MARTKHIPVIEIGGPVGSGKTALVGADLAVMDRDSRKMRVTLPFVFTNLLSGRGLVKLPPFFGQVVMPRWW